MGVFERQTKRGVVYYIAFQYEGRQLQRRHGTNKRDAEREHDRIVRAIEDGEWTPDAGDQTPETRLKTYATRWMAKRNNRSKEADEQRMRAYIVPALGRIKMADLKPKHVIAMVEEVKAIRSVKTANNVFALLKTMCRDAMIDELLPRDPCKVPTGTFKGVTKRRAPYTRDEVKALLDPEKVGLRAMVFNTLLFFTGMREGEVCGRRFRDWDDEARPLGCLSVGSQYDDQPLKTDQPRAVPVHPILAAVLTWWRDEGFERLYGRRPAPDDFLVLSKRQSPLTKSSGAHLFKESLAAAGVQNRTLHATRHTFITWAQRCGALKSRVQLITHNAKGDIVDQYTHLDWEPLCETVALLRYESPHSAPPTGRILGNPDASVPATGRDNASGLPHGHITTWAAHPVRSAVLPQDLDASHNSTHTRPGVRKTPVPPLPTGDSEADDFRAASTEHQARSEAWKAGQS